jgi:hypothetical protein
MIDLFIKAVRLNAVAAYCGVCACLLAGCSGSTQEAQVSGQVLLNGERIGPGIVVFEPMGGGKPAVGPIDESGRYSMSTSREAGLGAGRYKAAVSVREPANVRPGELAPPGKLLIPEKYENSATSSLEYEVEPGSNTIDIELSSQSSPAAGLRNRWQIRSRLLKSVASANCPRTT